MEFVLKHIKIFCIIIFLFYIFEPENEALTGCWRLLFNNGRVTVVDDVDEDISSGTPVLEGGLCPTVYFLQLTRMINDYDDVFQSRYSITLHR